MTLFDFILNITGLLIWLSWALRHVDPLARTTPATLVATVKRAEPVSFKGWYWLLALGVLLILRALFYFEIGSAIGWTPKLDLGLVVLAFRSDQLAASFLFSGLSFARILCVYYFWILVLVLLNWQKTEPETLLKLVRLPLGRLARLPRPVLMLWPALTLSALWLLLHPVLVGLGVVTAGETLPHLIEQGLLLSLVLILSLKYLLAAILLLHWASSYVYLGESPLWDFVRTTASCLLAPLRWLPLRFGKLDVAPVVAVLLVLLLLHWGPHLLEAELTRRGLIIWP